MLDTQRKPDRRPRPAPGGTRKRGGAAAAPSYKGPFATAGPYRDEELQYEVRLERVPGGLRLAAWTAGSIRRMPSRMLLLDLPGLLRDAVERAVFAEPDIQVVSDAIAEGNGGDGSFGRSPGRAGELRDELRVERLDDTWIRIARWIDRPNRGWELQEAPVMLPASRYVEALADAGRRGVLSPL